jgi:hypothetical protein
MTTPKKQQDTYFERLLDAKFDRVHEKLDEMKTRMERRDIEVNLLDTTNKAELKAVKDRVIAVETELGNVRYFLKAAVWTIGTVGAVLSWLFDAWGHLSTAVRNVT